MERTKPPGAALPYQYSTLLAGQWSAGCGASFQTFNPARPTETVGIYETSSPEQVGAAVEAAAEAQRRWARVPGLERQALVFAFLARLKSAAEEMARAITLEMGKPLADARGEIGYSLFEAEFMAGEAARSLGTVLPSRRPQMRNMTLRKPRGVVAAITPWNFPFLTPMRKIAPALVHGNAIVLKPSEYTPAAACMLAELAVGLLPDGLLGIVNGAGATGGALVSHPLVNAVTFTGSVPTGRRVYELAAHSLAEVSLELGGKNPIVLHDTADLPNCLNEIITGAMNNSGQRCTAVSRVLVQRALLAEVERGLAERMTAVRVGDGMDASSRIGPMAMRAQYDKVLSMIDVGRQEGARVAAGGGRARVAGFEAGYFVQPTLFCGVTPEMSVAREEIFGPVLSVIPYDTFEDALDIANGVDFGLAASLFSNDQRVVNTFIDHTRSGMLHINTQTSTDPNMPFIGTGDSGVGACSVGQGAAAFYTCEHAVYQRYAG